MSDSPISPVLSAIHRAISRPLLPLAAWFLAAAVSASVSGEEPYWPRSLKNKEAAPSTARSYVAQCLDNYQRELEAMRKLYEAQYGLAPSELDVLFSAAAIPQPSRFTLRIEGKLDDWWPDAGTLKGKNGILEGLSVDWRRPRRSRRIYLSWEKATDKAPSKPAAVWDVDQSFAADALTSDLTGRPRCVIFGVHPVAGRIHRKMHDTGHKPGGEGAGALMDSVSAVAAVAPGGGDVKGKARPKTGKHVDEQYARDEGYMGAFEAQWDSGLTGESHGVWTRVFADGKPGVHEIYAIGYNVFRGTTRQCPVEVKLAPQARFHIAWMRAFKAVRIGLRGVDLGKSGSPVSLVHVGQRDDRRAAIRLEPLLELDYGGGTHLQLLPADKFHIRTEGTAFRIEKDYDGRIAAYNTGGVGETKLCIETVSTGSGGRRLRSQTYTLAANRLRMVISPEPALGAVSAGTEYEVKVIAEGPGDMKDYAAFWEPLRLGQVLSQGKAWGCRAGGDWGKSTPFQREGTQTQVASTKLLVNAQSFKSWRKCDLEALLTSKSPRRRICPLLVAAFVRPTWPGRERPGVQLSLPSYLPVVPPAITKLELFARRSGSGETWQQASASFDLFTPGEAAARVVEFSCRVEFVDGTVMEHVAPDTAHAIALRMVSASGFSLDRSKLTWESLATRGMSKTEVCAVIRRDAAYSWSQLVLEPGVEELKTPSIAATGNRAVLASKAESGSVRYQLFVFGPAQMSQYRSRWDLRVSGSARMGTTESRSFSRERDGVSLATAHMAVRDKGVKGVLRRVTIVDPKGKPVCELAGSPGLSDGMTLRVYAPRRVPTSRPLSIVAEARHLNVDLANRLRCRWFVTPAVGTFDASETRLTPMGGGTFRSTGLLRLRNNAKDVGSHPRVAVELVLGD